jgi:hypothetical protein
MDDHELCVSEDLVELADLIRVELADTSSTTTGVRGRSTSTTTSATSVKAASTTSSTTTTGANTEDLAHNQLKYQLAPLTK